ncbi:hypothetical protein NUM3379_34400 [Kineococcus sp. NUM-3379]
MAGFAAKISKFLSTPQGRRLTGEAVRRAQRIAADPKARARIQQVATRLGQRRPGPRP